MAACSPEIFAPVSAAVLAKLRVELAKAGINLPENGTGTFATMGVKADVRWDEVAEELHIHVLEKPFLIGCEFIHSRIRDGIRKANEDLDHNG